MPSREDIVREAEARLGASLKGKWRLDSLLGFGGMAAVYGARHRNGKRVAIKVLHSHLAADRTVRSRFLREGYIANAIDHPAVVSIADDDVDGDTAFLVAELVEGETLEQLRQRSGGTLAADALSPIVAELLDVLAIAHDAGIVHRDIKPENLMMTSTGRLKVLDFGLAHARTVHDADLTGPGTLLGTPHFVAPEQAAGRWNLVDARTDLWAVGATMFRLLTGHHVHEGDSAQAVLARAATEPAESLHGHLPDAPNALVELVDRALAFSKAERFADARSMRDAVERATASSDWSVRPVQREREVPARSRGWLPALVLGGMAALVLSLLPRYEQPLRAHGIAPSSWATVEAPDPEPPPRSKPPPLSVRQPIAKRTVRVPQRELAPSSTASAEVPPPAANPLDRRK